MPTGVVIGANLIIFVLIFFSGVMSASEIAFFSLSSAELGALRESEDDTDNRVARLLDKPRYLLSSIVITNNLTNIGVIVTSYFVTRRMLHFSDITLFGFVIPGYVLQFVWNLVFVTFFLVLFGEATPKVYATHNKLKIARALSGVFALMIRFYAPINYVLVGSTKIIEKRLKRYNTEIDIEEVDIDDGGVEEGQNIIENTTKNYVTP